MKKQLENLKELHHTHKITHQVLSLTVFSIIVLLAVYGLHRVSATQDAYEKVPNGNPNICFKVGDNFNDPATHVSCKTYKKVCQTYLGTLIECDTHKAIN